MQQYFYKITHLPSKRVYVGCQYGQNSSPSNLWTTYFTSSPRIYQLLETDGVDSFVVNYTKPVTDARAYERRYLRRAFKWLGRDQFLRVFINRNLAPGIMLDGWALDNLKASLRASWNKQGRREQARITMLERHARGIVNNRGRIRSSEFKQQLSHRLSVDNPMKREDVRRAHHEAVTTPEFRERLRARNKGNTNVRGKHWWNNGVKSTMSVECPGEGWTRGRLNPHWNHNRRIKNGKKET